MKLPRNDVEDMLLIKMIKLYTIETEKHLMNLTKSELEEQLKPFFDEEIIIGDYE